MIAAATEVMTAQTKRELANLKRGALVDAYADQWLEASAAEERLKKVKRKIAKRLLTLARRHGVISNRAKTLRVVHGIAFDVSATYPSETIVDQQQAAAFWTSVSRGERTKFFRRDVRFTVRPGAHERSALLLNSGDDSLFLQWKRAVRSRAMNPRVKVSRVKPSRG